MRHDDVDLRRDATWLAPALDWWARSRRLALRGRTPSPDLLRILLGGDVAIQRTIWTDDDRPAGLFQVSDVSQRDGTGLLDLLVDPRHAPKLQEELARFLTEAFASLPLRKLCIWACDDEMNVPTYLGPLARLAGRLVGHDRRGPDHHADMHIYEIWKDDIDDQVPAASGTAGGERTTG
jgi:hypothetical protein